ncbi:MAG TPA: hypothetical protein VHR65_08360 [Solirubrobacterales bacterium]|nr:hypothetical protein [Solirubrobacterales bacterium]
MSDMLAHDHVDDDENQGERESAQTTHGGGALKLRLSGASEERLGPRNESADRNRGGQKASCEGGCSRTTPAKGMIVAMAQAFLGHTRVCVSNEPASRQDHEENGF